MTSAKGPPSNSQKGHHHHVFQVGDRIIMRYEDSKLDGRRGTIVGPQDKSSGCYPVCVDHTEDLEGSIVHLSPRYFRKKKKNKAHHHKSARDSGETPVASVVTPVICQQPAPPASGPVYCYDSSVAPSSGVPDGPTSIVIHNESINDKPLQAASKQQMGGSIIVQPERRNNCCLIACIIILACVAAACIGVGFIIPLLWWLWIVGIVCGILSCVFCCVICCNSDSCCNSGNSGGAIIVPSSSEVHI